MIRQLTLDDAIHVARHMRQLDRECVTALLGHWTPEYFAISRFQTPGPAWTLLDINGIPVAVFGLQFATSWLAIAWLMCVDEIPAQSWRKLIRLANTVKTNAFDHKNPHFKHRIEAHVYSEWHEASQFAEKLGFKFEGVRRKAGSSGEDFEMWAIVAKQEQKT